MNLNIDHRFSFSTHDEDGGNLVEFSNGICYADLRRTGTVGRIVNFYHSIQYFDYIESLLKGEYETLDILKWYYEGISYSGVRFLGIELINDSLIKVSYKIEKGTSIFSLTVIIVLQKYPLEFPKIWEYGYSLYNKLKENWSERHIKTCILLAGEYYTNNYYFENKIPFLNANHLIPNIRDSLCKNYFLTFSEEQFDKILMDMDNSKYEEKYPRSTDYIPQGKRLTSTDIPFSDAKKGTEDEKLYRLMKEDKL